MEPAPPALQPHPSSAAIASLLAKKTSILSYEVHEQVGQGTYSDVYKARHMESGEWVAMKKCKLMSQLSEGWPITLLREVAIMKALRHPNVCRLRDVVANPQEQHILYIVLDWADHDLMGVLNKLKRGGVAGSRVFLSPYAVKLYLRQVLEAVKYMHESRVVNRDVKGANVLLTHDGRAWVTDFGLARYWPQRAGGDRHENPLTPKVVTLWYRAPELLMGNRQYGYPVDLWGVGCVLGEMLTGEPFLQGDNELHQLSLIFKLLGCPTEKSWPGLRKLPFFDVLESVVEKAYPPQLREHGGLRTVPQRFAHAADAVLDLLARLLTLDPSQRISAAQALEHEYFSLAPRVDLGAIDRMQLPQVTAAHEWEGRQAAKVERIATANGGLLPHQLHDKATSHRAMSAVPRSQQQHMQRQMAEQLQRQMHQQRQMPQLQRQVAPQQAKQHMPLMQQMQRPQLQPMEGMPTQQMQPMRGMSQQQQPQPRTQDPAKQLARQKAEARKAGGGGGDSAGSHAARMQQHQARVAARQQQRPQQQQGNASWPGAKRKARD